MKLSKLEKMKKMLSILRPKQSSSIPVTKEDSKLPKQPKFLKQEIPVVIL